MAIDRTAFNALIDDDGSGTTGTPWNKAQIAGVILDPTDAAINPVNAPSTSPHRIGGPIRLAAGHLVTDTNEDADTSSLNFSGGGAVTQHRGATIILTGNEHALPGRVWIQCGTVAGARMDCVRNDGQSALFIDGATGVTGIQYGLRFPVSSVPSADVRTLDDYYEGTWTPTLTAAGGATGQTYAAFGGQFQKIGRWITLKGALFLSNKGTLNGDVQIGGFPYASSYYTPLTIVPNGLATAVASVSTFLAPGSAVSGLYYVAAGGSPNLATMTTAQIANASWFMISGQYEI